MIQIPLRSLKKSSIERHSRDNNLAEILRQRLLQTNGFDFRVICTMDQSRFESRT